MKRATAVLCFALLNFVVAGCYSVPPSRYQVYVDYLNKDRQKYVEPIGEDNATNVAPLLCSTDISDVETAVLLLTNKLPNGFDMTVPGIWQAGRLTKAYCENWIHAFMNLARAVAETLGSPAVYLIPQ